jgi:hypothetical protein
MEIVLYPSPRFTKAMQHLVVKVTGFEIIGDYMLRVRFDDGTEQSINFLPVLGGTLFRPLRDKKLFGQVRIDPECHALVWPNGADFDPATLHDWPRYATALAAQAKSWEHTPA